MRCVYSAYLLILCVCTLSVSPPTHADCHNIGPTRYEVVQMSGLIV